MTTVPTYPMVINSANVASTYQFMKDNHQALTANPFIVRETGEMLTPIVVGTTTYVCGPEYLLPPQSLAVQPYTANNASTIIHQLPADKDVLLTRWDCDTVCLTTLDGTHCWQITLTSGTNAGLLASVTDAAGTADVMYPQALTSFQINPVLTGELYIYMSVTKTSTPGNLYVYSRLTARNILATLT